MPDGRILVYGDVIDDIVVVPAGEIRRDADTMASVTRIAGGSAANTAAWLGAEGAHVTLFGRVGAEDLPRHDELLTSTGVRSRLTGDPDAASGTCVILVEGQHRTMLTQRGANARFDPEVITADELGGAAVLHVSGYVVFGATRPQGHLELAGRAAAAGVTLSVDPGSASFLASPDAADLRRIIDLADLLFPNLDEGRALTGEQEPDAVLAALARPGRTVALKLGRDGCLVDAGGERMRVPAPSVPVADSTGAGDAFAAGFLASLLRDGDPRRAAERAVAVAAESVASAGGRPAR